ncbi:DNA cross-link repair protein PSO2/SNM1 [Coemansia sp. RSA 485]|nr:DNA cross-link repair protein PSO2/SNM1 [Coemansia sp. RSA 485]
MRVFTTHILSPVTPDMLVIPAFESEADDVAQSLFVKEVTDWMPKIDYLYLDTTYLEPSYSFPRQSQVIETVGQFCHQINQGAGYLQAHLNEIRNENSKAKAKGRAKTVAVSKVSLITQWFRPTQKAIETNDSKDLMDVSNPTAKSKKGSRVLFVVGTYTIGKEKLFIDIACRIKSKIYVKPDKRKLLECIASPSIMALLTDDMYEAQVHAVSLGTVNMQGMSDYLASLQPKSNFTSIVAFSPTGWSHAGPYIPGRKETVSSIVPELPSAVEINSARQKQDSCALLAAFARSAHIGDDTKSAFSTQKLKPRGSSSKVTIFPVPYSEHSSFAELARFVCSLDIATIVPTVYSSSSDKNHSASNWLSHWQNLKALFKQNASSGRPYAFETQPQQTQPKHIKKESLQS